MRKPVSQGATVVVKVGSSSLTVPSGGLDPAAVARVADQIEALRSAGHPVVLVTSAAVAAGLPDLGLEKRPTDVPGLQVAAAVGQGRLMEHYAREFSRHSAVVGQVLLTRDILSNRSQYLHAREALGRMLTSGIVPVVNENDTVVVDELKLGDNDRLAAIVSHLVGAGMLVILSDTPGLYSDDPRLTDDAELLEAVRHGDEVLDDLRRQSGAGKLGSGGAASKVAAARMAAWSGIPTVICDANLPDAPLRAVRGEEIGTWVDPHEVGLPARKLWIAFGLYPEGRIEIDDGAVTALTTDGRSLLSVGITSMTGEFGRGAAVEVFDGAGALVGKGLASISSAELRASLESARRGETAIHRDDLVVLR